ncbi:hypothetical protein QBC47DRAFT_408295 [Echria macrotheca]|uniref:NADPH-dependent 1-acyldihydroxyacetone phosphate reductase n=1 Tax=Echria macrotheca TaxID=438768 RepID=A0AAJ0FGK0_9PEZI|nr:hypothetical protein QBC47DRAFT_408295 [Echria macrotheca]
MPSKSILVTGCSAGGIGAGLALALAKRGHHVFATARDTSKIASDLSTLSNVTVLSLDVTSAESAAAAARAVADSGRGLDILVNNAGLGHVLPILDLDIDRAQRVFDTNFWGVVRTVQAFSDLIIASRGRIVNVSSIGSVVNVPWISIYTASKAALNNFSEVLRLELAPFGVTVMTVMSGTVDSKWDVNNQAVNLKPGSRYEAIRGFIEKWANGQAKPAGCSIEEYAEVVVGEILGQRSGLVWRGPQSSAIKFIAHWMPQWVMDYFMSMNQGLKELSSFVAGGRKD